MGFHWNWTLCRQFKLSCLSCAHNSLFIIRIYSLFCSLLCLFFWGLSTAAAVKLLFLLMCSFPPFIHDGISTSNLFHFQLPFGSDFYSYFCERELSFWSRRPIVFLYILYFKNIYDVLFILCHCYSITNCLFSFSSWIFPCISSIPDCRWQVHAYFLAKVGVPFSALVSGVQKGGVAIRGSAQFGGEGKNCFRST